MSIESTLLLIICLTNKTIYKLIWPSCRSSFKDIGSTTVSQVLFATHLSRMRIDPGGLATRISGMGKGYGLVRLLGWACQIVTQLGHDLIMQLEHVEPHIARVGYRVEGYSLGYRVCQMKHGLKYISWLYQSHCLQYMVFISPTFDCFDFCCLSLYIV